MTYEGNVSDRSAYCGEGLLQSSSQNKEFETIYWYNITMFSFKVFWDNNHYACFKN